MSAKEIILTNNLAGGSSETYEFPTAIPNGKTWVVKKFGAADINMGDNLSSVYVLRFGTDVVKIISVTGNTYEIDMEKSFVGNGMKKLNVVVMNKSGFNKQMPFWLEGYSMES